MFERAQGGGLPHAHELGVDVPVSSKEGQGPAKVGVSDTGPGDIAEGSAPPPPGVLRDRDVGERVLAEPVRPVEGGDMIDTRGRCWRVSRRRPAAEPRPGEAGPRRRVPPDGHSRPAP